MASQKRMSYRCLEGCKITEEPDVCCNAWCANNYHQRCVGISAEEAALTDWVCNTCQDVTRKFGGSTRSCDTQDLMSIPSQEILALQNEAINILQPSSSDNLPVATNSMLQQHIALMTEAQQDSSSSSDFEVYSSPVGDTLANESEPDQEQTPQEATNIANERASQAASQRASTSRAEPEPDDDTEYVIEKIVKHHAYSDTDIWYLTKWENYPDKDNLWLPESAFTHAYDTLEEFKKANNLGKPSIPKPANRTYGASAPTSKINRNNWNTAERVIQVIRGFSHHYYRNALPITFLEKGRKPQEFDQVCLIELMSTHLITGLYIESKGMLYVADGLNSCFERQNQAYFADWNVELRPINFGHQTGIDHCTSSAAIIAIEFLKQFANTGTVRNDTIVASRTQLEAIKKAMHKSKSIAIKPHLSGRNNVPIYDCPVEGCDFKTSERSRRKLAMHQIKKHGAYKPL